MEPPVRVLVGRLIRYLQGNGGEFGRVGNDALRESFDRGTVTSEDKVFAMGKGAASERGSVEISSWSVACSPQKCDDITRLLRCGTCERM